MTTIVGKLFSFNSLSISSGSYSLFLKISLLRGCNALLFDPNWYGTCLKLILKRGEEVMGYGINKEVFMKILFLGILVTLLVPSVGSASWTNYELGTDTHTETVTTGRDSDWTDWIDCEDVSGANSAPRNLIVYELTSNGNFEKARLSCRQLDSWTTRGGYTLSDYFFNTDDDGDFDRTHVDSDQLPVGLKFDTICTTVSSFAFLQLSPDDILRGEDEAEIVSSEAGSSDFGPCPDYQPIQCNGGYVLTGMKFKIDDADWPYNGKVITGVSIRCTELIEN